MDQLDRALRQIKPVAAKCGIEAYIVGTQTEDDDGRLLKFCPLGMPTRPFLAIELNKGLRIYKLRDAALTRKYKGARVTLDWLKQAVVAHTKHAAALLNAEYPSGGESEPSTPARIMSAADIESLHAERREVKCSCSGEVEDCVRCSGSGSYQVDGFGNLA